MDQKDHGWALLLGALICAGLIGLGFFISKGIVTLKALERTVTVKGLSEREVSADAAIWPIKFNEVSNDLNELYSALQAKNTLTAEFLKEKGFTETDISFSVPSIQDRQAMGFMEPEKIPYRYMGSSIVTVYSSNVDLVRECMTQLVDLGKRGVAITGQDYDSRTEFLFTGLNDLKPAMIEEATRNAREVAEKFAKDSNSTLGKIRKASQGQFTIDDRDSNTPYIKKVRVVSTVEYYLSD